MPIEPRSEMAAEHDDVVATSDPAAAAAPNLLAPAPVVPAPTLPAGRFGVPRKLLAGLLVAQGTVWMTYFTPVLIALPASMEELSPDHYTWYLSVTLVVATLAGLLAGPLIGHFSDHSHSRFGRRRPWLLGSMAVGLIGTVAMAFASDVPVFVIGATLSQIGFGGVTAVQLSLLPEYVPIEHRGKVGAALGITTAVATIVGVGLTSVFVGSGQLPLAFLSVAVLGTVGILLLVLVIPDSTAAAIGAARISWTPRELAAAFYISPRRHPDFAWGWLSRFTFYLASASVVTYQLYYLINQLGLSKTEAASYVPLGTAAQVLMTVVGALVGGPLSDRIGRRKPFVALAAAICLLGLVVLALAPSIPLYLAGLLFIGLATGVYNSVDIALMTAVLPDDIKGAGKDLGVMNIANTLPNTLAPAFAPVLLSITLFSLVSENPGQNYTMLFLGSALFAFVSVVSVLKIRSVR
ncbi:MFS transporter [Kineococcus sp. R8]|uniref:MFS transporter n=1 Tax=Kineococcus siccus TaxID=2696567 RepID=UPI0014129DD4|nr:MFS transporter [Kineococcus siccus]NAZ82253.1 MFS transporter [Kineococcus siccus]